MSDDEDLEFRINNDFAERYNVWRRKEELQKLKDRYGDNAVDDNSSSSESEDDYAEALTPQLERDFFKTLSFVKSHDPKIYKKEETFYHYEENVDNQPKKKTKATKPVYLKDFERNLLLQNNTEEKNWEEDEEESVRRPHSPTYVEEQQMLKDSFKTALAESDTEDDDMILKKKKTTTREKEKEEADYICWLKGQKVDNTIADHSLQEMNALKQYWNDPELGDGEKFLRDYILNKGYVDKGDESGTLYHELADEGSDFSEEERLLDEQENFERKYNFRFEEPDSDFIKRYPRTVAESVRRKDKRRAEKRQDIKERKKQHKLRMKEDLKQLKNMKKKEILQKLDKLKQVTGNVSIGFENDDLEGDFDPQEHDKLMQKIFNEGYEECCDDEVKPYVDDEELEIENWDEWDGKNYEESDIYGEDDDNIHCEDPLFNMDADYLPLPSKDFGQEMTEITGKKKRRRASKFAQAVSRKKPVFNPDVAAFDAYFEEYYKLDYEDIIGDLPCRFKYRNVVANDFGLITEDILYACEQELNQWASLKKTCQYRSNAEEMKDVKAYSAKVKYSNKKEKLFTSLYSSMSDESIADNFQQRKKNKITKETTTEGCLKFKVQSASQDHINSFYSCSGQGSSKDLKVVNEETRLDDTFQKATKIRKKMKKRDQEFDSFDGKSTKILKHSTVLHQPKDANKHHHSLVGKVQESGKKYCVKHNKLSQKNSQQEMEQKGRKGKVRKAFKRNAAQKGMVKPGQNGGKITRRRIGPSGIEVSDARLKAYGIDPKKYMYRMKFLAKLKSRKKQLQSKSK